MFSIQKKSEEGFDKVVLRNEKTGNTAVILPACSALLHEFIIEIDGRFINVTEHYDSLDDFRKNVVEKGFRGCKLSPFACRIRDAAYTFGGREYHVQKSLPARHALHGELYDKPFELVATETGEQHAAAILKYAYRAEDPGYPFNYDCMVTWKLEPENMLTVTTTCINKDSGLIPVIDGWHPYFTLGDSIDALQLEFQAKEIVEFTDDLVPTGRLIPYTRFGSLEKIGNTVFDNCFTLDMQECQPLCVLRDPGRLEIQVFPGASYPYLQIYTPPHRKSIAIENLSGAPDAFNNGMGLRTLAPGETAAFATTYKIVPLNHNG